MNRKPAPDYPNDDRHGRPLPPGRHFRDHQGTIARDYYHHEFDRGYCPPGLVEKKKRLYAAWAGEKMADRPALAARRDLL